MCKEGRPVYARQHKFGKNIYDKLHRVDLIIFHPNLFPDSLVIQCKWQSSRGSVEEKYPFEVLNIKKSGCDTIFVLDGGGYTPGAKEWLLNQVGKDHLLYVFDQGEFSRFASKGNLG